MGTHNRLDAGSRRSAGLDVYLLLAFTALAAVYVLVRYDGRWVPGGDTRTFSVVIRSMLDSGRLVPEGYVYPNGHGFQALSTFLVRVSGLQLLQLQVYGSAFLVLLIVFPAWTLFRSLTGARRAATLATLIFLIQPELLFAIQRGTHEKYTRGLMMLSLFLLVRSVSARRNTARFAALIVAFYVLAYGIIAFNNFFATSFIVALTLALVCCWSVLRLGSFSFLSAELAIRRLAFATIISIVLAFIFSFYVYKPAAQHIRAMQSIWYRVVSLFLDVESTATDPYTAVSAGWIHPWLFFVLGLANWLTLFGSALIWLSQTIRLILRRWRPADERALLLWGLYGAFAAIGALSIIVDLSGALAGNLQHRMFPSFAMLAAPVIACWLIAQAQKGLVPGGLLRTWLPLGIALLAVLSLLKATNEPLLSNRWMFFISAEMDALDWTENALPDRAVSVDFDERLSAARLTYSDSRPGNAELARYLEGLGARDVLISDVTRARSTRLGISLPIERDTFTTYDNGQAQIYHLRPRTSFQR